jgi:polyphosphate kinase 2 (PPK2 family)
LTAEDWRNRAKWDDYQAATDEVLVKTSTLRAPWTIVEGNCKRYARIKTLKTLVKRLSQELDYDPFEQGVFKQSKKKK